ncbi:MAG: glycosyltransferase [Pseudomonadota bacterium]
MSHILSRLSQAALRHRALARRLVPQGLHHVVGSLARGFVQAAERTDAVDANAPDFPLDFPEPLLPADRFAADRVVLINDALAAGGAERQIVNTLSGLARTSPLTPELLCWRLGESPELSFHASTLESAGIRFGNVRTNLAEDEAVDATGLSAWLDTQTAWLPPDVRGRIVQLADDLARRRPGIVHAWQDETNLVAGLAALLVGVPRIVLSTRNVNPSGFGYHRPFMRAAYRALCRQERIVLSNNSHAGAQDYADWLGVTGDRFVVVHNGVETDAIAPADGAARQATRQRFNLPADGPVVGTVIRFNAEKQPLLWLAAAAHLMQRLPAAHFLMVGDGPMQAKIRSEARRLGLADRLVLPGPVQPVGEALAAMDAFLLSSAQEGLPNVTLEAGLAGLPVVTTSAGGAPETIDPGVTGLVVGMHGLNTEELAEALAGALHTVLTDPDWGARVRRLAPAFVAARFGMERMIEETQALYSRA